MQKGGLWNPSDYKEGDHKCSCLLADTDSKHLDPFRKESCFDKHSLLEQNW